LLTEAATAVLAYGWKRFDFDRILAVASINNAPSIRLMKKLGMAFDKTFVHMGTEVVQYTAVNPVRAPIE